MENSNDYSCWIIPSLKTINVRYYNLLLNEEPTDNQYIGSVFKSFA